MNTRRSRRRFLQSVAASAGALPMFNFGMSPAFAGTSKRYPARVLKLVRRSLVIDMLGPLKLDFTSVAWSGTLSEKAAREFRDSGVTAVHHAIGIGDPDAYASVMQYLAAWNGFIGRNSDLFRLVDRVEDLDEAKESGKVAVIMGLQNSEHFRSADDVRTFYELGQRCSQLTYNSQNFLGSGSTDRIDGGVSDYGAQIIQRMNEVGMLIDVSHCGDKTTLDAIEISARPIAITHSNCRALNGHPRLKTDEAIRKVAVKGGVVGITGVRNFVRDREPTTIEHLIDQIDHVVKLTGIEHVGIGTDSDLNGADDMPPEQLRAAKASYKSSYAFREKLDTDGFDGPLRFYDLTEALLRRGYSDANVEAILGGNFRRLLAAAWTTSDSAAGWRALFDGKTTNGWRNFRERGIHPRWRVIDGALTLTGAGGGDIVTEERFANFELVLDWRIAEGDNGGIFYHVSESAEAVYHTGPEYQLLDDAHAIEPPLERAGSLFALYAPTQSVAKPAGEFNHTRLVVDHGRVEHWLNGVKVVEYRIGSEEFRARVAASKFAGMPGFAQHDSGHIALQDHGNVIAFRNVRIRPLD